MMSPQFGPSREVIGRLADSARSRFRARGQGHRTRRSRTPTPMTCRSDTERGIGLKSADRASAKGKAQRCGWRASCRARWRPAPRPASPFVWHARHSAGADAGAPAVDLQLPAIAAQMPPMTATASDAAFPSRSPMCRRPSRAEHAGGCPSGADERQRGHAAAAAASRASGEPDAEAQNAAAAACSGSR